MPSPPQRDTNIFREVIVPEPAIQSVTPIMGEIILPPQDAVGKVVICDCCRKTRLQSEFDDDCCGICEECLRSDLICVDMDLS